MSEVTIVGKLIESGSQRDAIHVAVAPVVAAERLSPGQHVALVSNDQETVGSYGTFIGIVDPFLLAPVYKGDRFWLFLYPQTITSLRHNWTHPAFAQQSPIVTPTGDRTASEKWLRNYAKGMNIYDSPDEAYERLLDGLRSGDLFAHGSDLHSFSELDDADQLKHHAEIVLGERIDWAGFTFSCSC